MYATKGFGMVGDTLMLCIFGLNLTSKSIEWGDVLQVEFISKVSLYVCPKSKTLG